MLRSHFKEPSAISLYTELSNSKQLSSESAAEFVVSHLDRKLHLYLKNKLVDIVKPSYKILSCILFWLDKGTITIEMNFREDILENFMLAM